MKGLLALMVLAAVACTESTSMPASATAPGSKSGFAVGKIGGDMLVNDVTPVTFVFAACNGESVTMSGTLHFTTEITTPSNGSVHLRMTNDYTLSGVGSTTGAKYEGGIRFVDKENFNSGAATVFDVSTSARLIAQGNVPNTWVDFGTAFTIDANGNITHDVTSATTRCS